MPSPSPFISTASYAVFHNRARFSAVSRAVQARKEDVTKIDADQAAFLAQRDTAGGKTTMTSYLWSICGAEYDNAHPRS